MRQVVAYQRLKTIGNHCRQAQKLKWSWSLTGGGHLRETPTVRLWKILVLWIGGRF